ncbi:unnamed protein product [Aureobasidium vineae]|uniref:Uncharacterized protein n=1 Tax=Aureobasidium vineae TaxID=2773715 RepID=A0A9N8K1B1_9PEZI|nr:unnamed protein product [Aureobasidium vineae]
MTTSKIILIMLALQLLCSGFLAQASSSTVIPHEFTVCLEEGYPLDSHFKYIGKELNISQYLELINCYNINFYNTTRVHDDSEEAILDLIRSDSEVVGVARNIASSLNDFEFNAPMKLVSDQWSVHTRKHGAF